MAHKLNHNGKDRGRPILVGVAGIALTVLLAGCVGASSPTPTESASGMDSLVIAAGDITALDPASIKSTAASLVTRNVYGTLFLQDMAPNDEGAMSGTGTYSPGLAESIEWADDGLSAVITLKPDAKFTSGEPILAEDAVYSIQRTLSPVSSSAGLARFMGIGDASKDVIVIDDTSFKITLTTTTSVLEKILSFQSFAILDKSVADEHTTADDPWALDYFATDVTSSGPYVISDWTAGSSLTMKADPQSAQVSATSPKNVTIDVIPDATQRLLAVSGGAADVALELPPELLAEAAKDPGLSVNVVPTGSVHYLGMNNTVAPFNDVRVRQAFALAVPYQSIVDAVMLGYGQVAGGPIPEPISGSAGLDLAYDTDLDKAKDLLEQAGIKDGDLTLDLAVSSAIPAHVQAATFIQEALGKIGVIINVVPMSNAEFSQKRLEGSLPLFLSWWSSWGMDPFYQMYFLLRSGVPTNFVDFSNPEFDDLIDRGIVSTDADERDELALEAQKIALEESPMVYLYTDGTALVTRSDVQGVGSGDDRQPRLEMVSR
jgi:peptide/nickel transport system substrate-binding protein